MNDDDVRRQALKVALLLLGETQTQIQESLASLDIILKAKAATGPMFLDNATQGRALQEAFGWDSVIRREYGTPDGRFQGKFFCSKADEGDALSGDHAFWVRVVLPQMYASRRPDVFHMIGGFPEDDWLIGRP